MTRPRRRILGIDPGSRSTGYGVLDAAGDRVSPVAWGVISGGARDSLPDRLFHIHEELLRLIRLHRPGEASVETVFLAKNAAAALKLGQARGAALVACRSAGLTVHEYSAREVKLSVTGFGAAPKEQVADMVCRLLGLRDRIPPDASDALAMAFCRAVHRDFRPQE